MLTAFSFIISQRGQIGNKKRTDKKAPLCKGGWQKSLIFDWGIVLFVNPSGQNQRF